MFIHMYERSLIESSHTAPRFASVYIRAAKACATLITKLTVSPESFARALVRSQLHVGLGLVHDGRSTTLRTVRQRLPLQAFGGSSVFFARNAVFMYHQFVTNCLCVFRWTFR